VCIQRLCSEKTLLKVVEDIVILAFLSSTRYCGQLRKSKTLSRLKRSHPRTSSTRYLGHLFESKITLELYSVNPTGPCLIIFLCNTHYLGHQKEKLNKLLQLVPKIYSFDGLRIGNRNISVRYAKTLRGVYDSTMTTYYLQSTIVMPIL